METKKTKRVSRRLIKKDLGPIYYIYIHRDLDGNIRYAGMGHGDRCIDRRNRCTKWHEVFDDIEIKYEKLYENLTEKMAFKLETKTIYKLRKEGCHLVNIREGGK